LLFQRRFITTMALWRHDRVCTKSGIIGLNLFVLCCPAALPHTVRQVRRFQYQFTRFW